MGEKDFAWCNRKRIHFESDVKSQDLSFLTAFLYISLKY
jgi:hypothetical protein